MRLAHLIDYYASITKYFKIVFLPFKKCHHRPSSDSSVHAHIFSRKKPCDLFTALILKCIGNHYCLPYLRYQALSGTPGVFRLLELNRIL